MAIGVALELVITCPYIRRLFSQYGPVSLVVRIWMILQAEMSQILRARPQLWP